jgi:F-type H+-transporting ATPase subunit delta
MPSTRLIHVGPVEHTYAQALLALAEEAGQVEALAAEVADLADLMQNQAGVQRLLGSKVLSISQRADAVARLFRGRVSDLLLRFLMVVNRGGRLGLLPGIARSFLLLVEQKHGVVEIDAYVPAEMDAARAQAVAARLGQVLGRQVALFQHADPALIGGLKVRVGDQLIDGTVAAQLRMIRQHLEDVGREKARQQAGPGSGTGAA